MKTYTILLLLFFFSLEIPAQINPFNSSVSQFNLMEVSSQNRNKVMLLPRVSEPLPTPAHPSLIYNTTTNNVNIFYNSTWHNIVGDNEGNAIASTNLIVKGTTRIKQNDNRIISLANGSIELLNVPPSGDNYKYKMQNDGNFVISKNNADIWSSNLSVSRHSATNDIVTNRWGILRNNVGNAANTRMIAMDVRINSTENATIMARARTTGNNRYLFAIQADGGLHVYNSSGQNHPAIGSAYATFSAGGRAIRDVSSDRRVKHVLAPIEEVLDRVAKMEIIEYKYKKEVAHLGMTMAPLRIGFIAQDVIQLFPRYTATLSKYSPETNRYTLYYKFFGVLALKSIQDFKIREDKEIYEIKNLIKETAEKEEVIQLESKIEMFNKKVKDLESKLHSLNKKLGRG